jgi:predicted GIY-YIG superfamily endonuclease
MIGRGGSDYIMSSHSRCLYVGVTSDLQGRVWEHKNGVYEGFSKKYKTQTTIHITESQSSLNVLKSPDSQTAA